MQRLISIAAVAAATSLLSGCVQHAAAPVSPKARTGVVTGRAIAPEARVAQVSGRVRTDGGAAPAKLKPGLAGNGGGPAAPATCGQQNADSQACYTATQQSRPLSR
ncbi:hypothetical protein [Bosea sp. BK604]|uniref:hypothetical protein n=1 Tax=Bosea sp. BK604 TaxID=2512180 RepID=UPI001050D7CF|nr:hypothetical protein [Bosea sp. BK604]TCR63113.1 hypothetical protein EV560_109207 [Bosea sp. BK604]